jgi:hypothetical protein
MNSNHVLFLQVKYRIDGDVAKTICHVDEKAKDIEHAKKVSQQVSKVRPQCMDGGVFSIRLENRQPDPAHQSPRPCELNALIHGEIPLMTEVAHRSLR